MRKNRGRQPGLSPDGRPRSGRPFEPYSIFKSGEFDGRWLLPDTQLRGFRTLQNTISPCEFAVNSDPDAGPTVGWRLSQSLQSAIKKTPAGTSAAAGLFHQESCGISFSFFQRRSVTGICAHIHKQREYFTPSSGSCQAICRINRRFF